MRYFFLAILSQEQPPVKVSFPSSWSIPWAQCYSTAVELAKLVRHEAYNYCADDCVV